MVFFSIYSGKWKQCTLYITQHRCLITTPFKMAAPLKISGFCCRNEKPLANFIYRFLSTSSATKDETWTKKESRETHFGFETVAEDEKEERG